MRQIGWGEEAGCEVLGPRTRPSVSGHRWRLHYFAIIWRRLWQRYLAQQYSGQLTRSRATISRGSRSRRSRRKPPLSEERQQVRSQGAIMSSEPQNCEKFRIALKDHVGETLSTRCIRNLVWKKYRDMPAGSNQPSEHAGTTNETQCSCAGTPKRIFDKVKHGTYTVRTL